MAPKVSTTPRNGPNPAQNEPEIPSILEFLGKKPPEPTRQQQNDAQVTQDAILARLGRMEDENRRLARVNEGLLMAGSAPAPASGHANGLDAAPVLDLTGLPDPITEPEANQKALTQRMNDFVEKREVWADQRRQLTQAQTGQGERQHTALWNEFAESYEAYAEDPDKVELAAKKVLRKMSDKGIDVNRYMVQATDLFFEKVKEEFDKTFGAPESTEEPNQEQAPDTPAPRGARVKTKEPPSDDFDPGRTGGIFGGQESGGAPSKQTPKDQPGDMIKDLTDLQRNSGLF